MERRAALAAALLGVTGLAGVTACSDRPASRDLTGGSSASAPVAPSSSVASSSVASSSVASSSVASSSVAPPSVTPSPATPVTSATSVPSASAPAGVVPVAYRGRWNTRLADCRAGTGEGRLVVEARAMAFYESEGRVVAVTPRPGGISVTLKLTGEGETWEDTRTWRLSADGTTLTDVTHGATRSRCP